MESFLGQVAEYLHSKPNEYLRDLKVVFPNRRSVVFFTEEFGKYVKSTSWMPELITISDFISSWSTLNKGSEITLLHELYLVYVKLSGSKESFDQFFNWGEILLKDFDDIDKYGVSPDLVFTNVRNIKELENHIDYLTEDQISVLKRFFSSFSDMDHSTLQKSFLEVWQVMLPMYNSFNDSINQKGISYEGAIFKQASENVRNTSVENLPNVAFVGFNAITKCEEQIFDHFGKHEKGLYFWDFDRFYVNDKYQEAGLFLRKYLKKFPSPDDFKLKSDITDKNKSIQIISSPTDHGQIAVASGILSDETINMEQTALVLANEELLFPVINSLPETVSEVNPTMGYSVMKSNAGSFSSLYFKLHQNKRIASDGKVSFYYLYVLRLLKHPFFITLCKEKSDELILQITENNIFYVKSDLLGQLPVLGSVFGNYESTDLLQQNFETVLSEIITNYIELVSENSSLALDLEILFELRAAHRQLASELNEKNIVLDLATYIRVFTKQVHSLRIPFEAEMLGGLQLMGFLETRNLDFSNLIILSVNEGQLPLNQVRSSFIPYSLRKGFGLPDAEMHGAMYAYYFYRLLQRADNVYMVYNNGESGLENGERSRFISQLIFNDNFNTTEKIIRQSISSSVKADNVVIKNEYIYNLLSQFTEGDNKRILSPSAIVRYLMCPLKFYFYSLLRLYEQDEVEEHVDARIFGNIFHKAAEVIYKPYSESGEVVTGSELKKLAQPGNIKKVIDIAFNDSFNKKGLSSFEIVGKNVIVESVIENYLQKMLETDEANTPFNVVETEGEYYSDIRFNSANKELSVKVGGTIDRVDRSSDGVRIMDYKTGNDELIFKDLDDLFNPLKISKYKAILQTFVYSLVYMKETGEAVVKPSVLQVKKLFVPDMKVSIESKGEPEFSSGNFVDIADNFNERLQNLLSEIFNPEIPFTETHDSKNCNYCAYKLLCGKQ